MSHSDPHTVSFNSFQHFTQRRASSAASPWSPQHVAELSPSAVLVALVAGLYALATAFAFLGFPLHRIPAMALNTLSRTSSSGSDKNGVFGGLFGGLRNLARPSSSDTPPGLGNWDNSCYQNSIIQGLASLPSLERWLRAAREEHPDIAPDSTHGALLSLLDNLNDPSKRGQHFWIRGKLKNMSTWTQQDAQEYYSRILDELDNELKAVAANKRRSSASISEATKEIEKDAAEGGSGSDKDSDKDKHISSIGPNPLEGLLAQRVGCTACGYSEGLSLTPFNCAMVSLGRRAAYDIRECLDEYTRLEYIDGVECAKCTLVKLQATLTPLAAAKPDSPFADRLKAVQAALDEEDFEDKTLIKTFNILKKNWAKCTKSKQSVIARAPKSLVMHVNRSIFDEMAGVEYKNNAGVQYPDVLDLGNWCLGSQPSDNQKPDVDLEEWPRDPNKSMLARDEPAADSPFRYRLRAAVTHFGTHGNGHYIAYRPHPKIIHPSEDGDSDADTEVGSDADAEADVENSAEEPAAEESKGTKANADETDEANDSAIEITETAETTETTEGIPEKTEENEKANKSDVIIDPTQEQWWRFSDDSVYSVSGEQAHQGNVFMLFYERIDSVPSAPGAAMSSPIDAATATQLPAEVTIPSVEPTEPGSENDSPAPATTGAYPTPPPDTPMQSPKLAAVGAELTIEADADELAASTSKVPVSPHTMRTAGNAVARGQGSRASLPMVSPT